jgi:hypothetical protein
MGYRSQIAFCISVNQVMREDDRGSKFWDYDKAKFKEMVGFFKLTKFYEIATDSDYDLINLGKKGEDGLGWKDGAIVFHATDWKWYDDYPLVVAFEEMWDTMQDIEGISGYFLRVGEGDGNQTDIEDKEFGDSPEYGMFAPYASMSFDADHILGESNTDEEEPTEQAQTSAQAV